jgi:hypothetical protein
MKSFIPHNIITINRLVKDNKDLDVLHYCYRMAFDWANRMGLEGKRVYDLEMLEPPMNDVFFSRYYLCCKIECTLEERRAWEDQQVRKLLEDH